MNYRKDIDGLRAIAVLSVIFYHLGFPFISGGFIGVDIFFVISGFLITQSIQHDLKRDVFTIKNFYIKRIRRIIPVLFLVTMTTLIASFFILGIEELKEFALSLISVSIFSANIFFWQNIDYFSVSAELKPLLHTWSLGIEEQFYIFFPLFMMWTATWRSKKVFIGTAIFTLLSFALCLSPFGASHIQANFFLPITRFWELFMGVLLALFLSRDSDVNYNHKIDNILALLGLGFIVAPLLLLDYNSLFPSINAFYPVLGAVLIIHSGYRGESFLVPILSNIIVRYIGLISFSLYLWHWVIIAFAKNMIMGEFSLTHQFFMLLLTFALSALSYRFVEEPFRRKKELKEFLGLKQGFMALLMMLLSGVGLFIFLTLLYPDTRTHHNEINCFQTEVTTLSDVEACTFGDKNATDIVVLYGDSHVSAIYPAFEKFAKEHHKKGIAIAISGCVPLFDVFREDGVGNSVNCSGAYSKNIEKFLENNANRIEHLYMVARWGMYERGYHLNGRLQKATHFISDNQTSSKTAKESAGVLKRGIKHTINKISNALAIPMTILKSVPELHGDIGKRGIERVTKEEYLKQLSYTNDIFKILEKSKNVNVISPLEIFCPTDSCQMFRGNKPLYRDDNHVNYEGAMMLYPLLEKNLESI